MTNLFKISVSFCFIVLVMSFIKLDNESNKIYEGESIGKLKIGMTLNQVNSVLRTTFEKIKWGDHSFEYIYRKEGISVYILQNDSTQKVFSITASPSNWGGITNKGLKINSLLKIKNVIDVYGNPEWGYTADCSELDASYYDIGIYFSVDTISGICDETKVNHDSLFMNNAVTEITIGKIGTDY